MSGLRRHCRDDSSNRESIHFAEVCDRGGIGRRASLRSWWGNPWGFESLRSHWPPTAAGFEGWWTIVKGVEDRPDQILRPPPPSSTTSHSHSAYIWITMP